MKQGLHHYWSESEPGAEDECDAGLVIDAAKFPVGRYRPLKALGGGGGGTVYKCWDEQLRRPVAVKVLIDLSSHETLVSFQQEAVATAKVKHPNVIGILDFGVTDFSTPYMVLEYFSGLSLERFLAENGPLDPALAVKFFLQLTDALAYGHDAKVFHRDIKSSNVLVVEDESGSYSVKLLDFGIAAIMGNQTSTQVQGRTLVGTPTYMSPDQAMGLRFDARSEIYSLGCLMFEALTGRVPFVGEDPLALISQHSNQPIPLMKDVADVPPPPELEDIVRKCLAKKPDDRYQTMRDLNADIETAEKSMLARADYLFVETDESPDALNVESGTKARLAGLVAVVVTLFTGFVLILYFGGKGENRSSGSVETKTEAVKPIAPLPMPLDVPEEVLSSSAEFKFSRVPLGGVQASLADNGVVDAKSLSSLANRTDLHALNVSGAEFNGAGLEYVADHPIEFLDLGDTDITDKAFLPVFRMKRLLFLNIENCCELTDEALRGLRSVPLLQITIRGTGIGDEGLAFLKDVPTLEILNLTKTPRVTAAGLRRLKGHPKLRDLTVDFDDRPLEYFQAIADLGIRDLTIESRRDPAKMTDEILNTLMNFKRLTFVNLDVSKEQLARLSQSRKLDTLSFRNSLMTGVKLKALANSSIKEVTLSCEPNIRKVAFLELRRFKSLKQVYIQRCPQVPLEAFKLLRKERPDIEIHDFTQGEDGR